MKSEFILTILIVIMMMSTFGCWNNEKPDEDTPLEKIIHEVKESDVKIVVIDSCEYIIFKESMGTHGFGAMAHKGNCKNSIHDYGRIDKGKP